MCRKRYDYLSHRHGTGQQHPQPQSLYHHGRFLQVAQTMEVDNTLTLAGGTLRNTHIVRGVGGLDITLQPMDPRLTASSSTPT